MIAVAVLRHPEKHRRLLDARQPLLVGDERARVLVREIDRADDLVDHALRYAGAGRDEIEAAFVGRAFAGERLGRGGERGERAERAGERDGA